MKVIVLGAGVIGVSTAWFLHKAGHQVTVIDRAEGAAMETSFGNAGQLSYGYTTPWASPGIPQKAAKWMMKPHSPLILRPDGSAYQLKWLGKMLANCDTEHYKLNKERMVRVSEYSREMFARLDKAAMAFLSSSLTIACVILTAGVTMFPFVMPSSTVPNVSLTMWDATSSLFTLQVMTVVAIIFVPIVLAYTAWAYYKMFGRLDKNFIEKNKHSLY